MKENLMGLSGAMMQRTEQNAVYQDFEVLLEDIDLLCQKEKLFLPLTNIPIWLHPIRQSHPCYRNTLTLAGKHQSVPDFMRLFYELYGTSGAWLQKPLFLLERWADGGDLIQLKNVRKKLTLPPLGKTEFFWENANGKMGKSVQMF